MLRSSKFCLALGLLIASLMTAKSQARAAELYGVTFEGVIYNLAVPTGVATNPRPTNIPTLSGLAVSPGGTWYGHDSATNHLFQINPITGQSTQVGFLGLDVTEGDLVFHPQTGVLYGTQTFGVDKLYTIDTQTGHATVVGEIAPFADISALAFDAAGTLWALDTMNGMLYTLDPQTAGIQSSVTLVGDFLGTSAGMDFDPETGLLWVASNNLVPSGCEFVDPATCSNPFYQLATDTGLLRPMGATGLTGGLSGLRFVPEPSTAGMCFAAGLALLMRRRRLRA